MSEITYLLAIDGGGTKTDFLLTDLNDNEIKRIILSSSNPVATGIENTKKCLSDGINTVCDGIDKKSISLFAGIAGGKSGDNEKIISDYLSSFGFGKTANGSDTDSALEVTLGGQKGISIIIGTGICAFADAGNVRHKIGGWGYLIDKGGSGFHLGSAALESAFSFYDKKGGSEAIYRMVEEKSNMPLPQAIPEIYKKGNSYIASFAPLIFRAYEKGDKDAEKILLENTAEIARLITAGQNLLGDKKTKTVFCGGLCKEKDILGKFISRHLSEDAEIEFCKKDIVQGALSLARKNIDE